MNKAILVIDMPKCCNECKFLNDNYDYPECIVTGETKGYTFRTKEQKMNKCPLKELPERMEGYDSIRYQWGEYEDGWNHCIDMLID